ncbi:hypothetical protein BGX24_005297 [Mortierella sp. AD032]|nr:hypothetical protein BGX24_005297 [Mortierella sp. AD032]
MIFRPFQIPCAKCEQRFHYDCLKKWFNLDTNEYDLRWKCPICREFCNCTECSKNNWGRSNEKRGSGLMLTRNGSRSGLRSSGTNPLSNTSSSAKRGDDSGGDKVYADQKGLGNGSLRQEQQQQRSRNLARWMTDDYGDDDLKTERSTRSQPSRAAVRMAKGRLRKEVSFNDDEDVFVTSETMTKPKKAVTKTEDKDDNDGDNDDGSGGIYVDEGEADVSGEDLDEYHEVDRGLSSKRKRMAQY